MRQHKFNFIKNDTGETETLAAALKYFPGDVVYLIIQNTIIKTTVISVDIHAVLTVQGQSISYTYRTIYDSSRLYEEHELFDCISALPFRDYTEEDQSCALDPKEVEDDLPF